MSQTLAFFLPNFNERGVVRSTLDYAKMCEKHLGHRSIIVVPEEYTCHFSPTPSIMEKYAHKHFRVVHTPSQDSLDEVLTKEGADFLYIQKSGTKDGWCSQRIPTGIHCVFQEGELHGTRFAAISEWLAQELSAKFGTPIPYVSLPISGPRKSRIDLRRRFGIPNNAVVFGRYGGRSSFDLKFVHQTIDLVLHQKTTLHFLFMNTETFLEHPRIHYLPTTTNVQNKVDFIHACDAMLHGRARGESFGLSIAEFLYQGKPVLAWEGGMDKNHLHMLSDVGILYREGTDLARKILQFDPRWLDKKRYQNATLPYSEEVVIQQFQKVFLS